MEAKSKISRAEHDRIAARAGINIEYPGISDYKSQIGTGESISLYNKNRHLYSHSIDKSLVASHKLRLTKLSGSTTLPVLVTTGNSEYSTSYLFHDKKLYQRNRRKQHTYPDKLPFLGRSEYVDKFNNGPFDEWTKPFDFRFTMNPKPDIERAIYPRKQARPDYLRYQDSEYKTEFVQLKPDNLAEKLDWIKKK